MLGGDCWWNEDWKGKVFLNLTAAFSTKDKTSLDAAVVQVLPGGQAHFLSVFSFVVCEPVNGKMSSSTSLNHQINF